MNIRNKTPLALALAAVLALGACGHGGDEAVADEETSESADEAYADEGHDAQDEATAGEDVAAPAPTLAAGDLDAIVKGLAAENDYLDDAVRRLREADGNAEVLAALGDVGGTQLDQVGADAAGMSVDDFLARKEAVFDVLGQVEMRAMLVKQYGNVDTTGLDADMAANARRNAEEMLAGAPDPYLGMEPSLAEALHAREAQLSELRARQIGLLFAVVKGG